VLRYRAMALGTLVVAFFSYATASSVDPRSSWALNVEWVKDASGAYVPFWRLNCSEKSQSLCQFTCQAPNECRRTEPLCRNCGGTTSPLLRLLFTRPSRFFRIQGQVDDPLNFFQLLMSHHFVLLTADSPYNFYTSVDDPETGAEFARICPVSFAPPPVEIVRNNTANQRTQALPSPPIPEQRVTFVVRVSDRGVPLGVNYVLCPGGPHGGPKIFQLGTHFGSKSSVDSGSNSGVSIP
jgi:hypothetical protein